MRIEHIVYLHFDELNDEAKEKARQWYREGSASDTNSMDEVVDSLKSLFKAASIKLTDWSIGAYNQHNYVTFDMGDAGELSGPRALTWLENNLFAGLRMTSQEYKQKRKEYLSYGELYRPGKVRPCPLTGVYYDEDLLDALREAVKLGDTLGDAFRGLADTAGNLIEKEYEYKNEDEQIDDTIRANEYEFTVDGERA